MQKRKPDMEIYTGSGVVNRKYSCNPEVAMYTGSGYVNWKYLNQAKNYFWETKPNILKTDVQPAKMR